MCLVVMVNRSHRPAFAYSNHLSKALSTFSPAFSTGPFGSTASFTFSTALSTCSPAFSAGPFSLQETTEATNGNKHNDNSNVAFMCSKLPTRRCMCYGVLPYIGEHSDGRSSPPVPDFPRIYCIECWPPVRSSCEPATTMGKWLTFRSFRRVSPHGGGLPEGVASNFP